MQQLLKGIGSWLIDPQKGNPLVAAGMGLAATVLARVSGLDQTAVDACVSLGRGGLKLLGW